MTIISPSMSRLSADRVKVYVISVDQLVITGMQKLLAPFATMAYGRGEDVKAIEQVLPHLIIIDISIDASPLYLLPKLKDIVPSPKIILLGGLSDIAAIRHAGLLRVDGIVLTTQPAEVLLLMCQHLMPGLRKGTSMPTEPHDEDSRPSFSSLTEREQTIVGFVSQGLSNKEISDHLGMSTSTVRHHLTKIFDKLGVAGRQGLIIKTLERTKAQLYDWTY